MGPFQRPPTLKEIVIQSLLRWRDAADTVVDSDEELQSTVVDPEDRVTEIDPFPAPRPTQDSVVFDLAPA